MTTRFLLILSFFLFPLFSSCGKSDSPVGNEKEDLKASVEKYHYTYAMEL